MSDDEEFISTTLYFWNDKGDPTRWTGFNEERCKRLMPVFWDAWQRFQLAQQTLEIVAKHYRP